MKPKMRIKCPLMNYRVMRNRRKRLRRGGETDSNEELEENAEKKTCVTEDGWKEMEEGKTFYVSDGKVIRDSWHKVGDHKYYFGTDGIMYKNCRFQVRSEDENVGWGEYRVDKSGRMVTGW